ncbi:MAG: hypothetical protein LBV30_00380 [Propionibacteriaceae bacterium]|jgi:hypothetical protein|nr:hypothetical protein [Propionibacteriaceae bacterium]
MSVSLAPSARKPRAYLAPHCLRLIWQNPATRQFIAVGRFTDLDERGGYVFEYLPGAEKSGLVPLVEFPDFNVPYVSSALPAFFANRVMSRRRPGYEEYVSWLGLQALATPMEVLARTGGPRATDTFHLVYEPEERDGVRESRFFVSGISHVKGASDLITPTLVGQVLTMRDDTHNPVNARAILIDSMTDQPIGWVPDWLVDEVHQLRREGTVELVADQVNPSAPPYLRLLCRLSARRPGTPQRS